MDEFKRQIAVGFLKPGDKVPSQRDLATQLKVNANTVQRAYREMELLGLVETLRGQGTFITSQADLVKEIKNEMLTNLVANFVQAMQALGYGEVTTLDVVRAHYKMLNEEGQKEAEAHDKD